jgi:hypothetical protein
MLKDHFECLSFNVILNGCHFEFQTLVFQILDFFTSQVKFPKKINLKFSVKNPNSYTQTCLVKSMKETKKKKNTTRNINESII